MADYMCKQHKSTRPPPESLGINVEKPKYPQFAPMSRRLESFASWPEHLPVAVKDLVEAGLVYTGVGDSVRCFQCGGGLRNWEPEDDPMKEHAKWFPACSHILLLKGKGYIEKVQNGEPLEEVGFDSAHGLSTAQLSEPTDYLDSPAAQSCIDMGFSNEMVKKAISIYRKKHGNPDFKGRDLCVILLDMEESQEEFDDIDVADNAQEPISASNNLDELGLGESVRCYLCGGVLRNFEPGDDLMKVHAKWYPTCPHLLLVKGKRYIEEVRNGGFDFGHEFSSVQIQDSKDYLDSPAAQSCIQNGYSNEMLEKAISIYRNRHGKTDFKGRDLCKILFEMEDWDYSELFHKLLEENERLKNDIVCKICFANRADVVFLPCGHMVTCPQCAPAMTKCLMCHKTINGQIKAFFANMSD